MSHVSLISFDIPKNKDRDDLTEGAYLNRQIEIQRSHESDWKLWESVDWIDIRQI